MRQAALKRAEEELLEEKSLEKKFLEKIDAILALLAQTLSALY
jgi:hypothetical protein